MNYCKNYVGKMFGKFKVLKQKRGNNCTYLYAKCTKCGKERWIALKHIKDTKCCESKASSTQFKAYVPDRKFINNIELIKPTSKRQGANVVWECRCFCGNIFYATLTKIKDGRIKSCGCSKIRYTPENLKKAKEKFKEKNLLEGTSLFAITPKIISTNTSGHTGVVWSKDKQKWIAQIEFKGHRHFLGYHSNIEDAIFAREEAEKKYFKPILEKYKKRQA